MNSYPSRLDCAGTLFPCTKGDHLFPSTFKLRTENMKPLLDTSQRMGERAREGACPNAQNEAGLSILPKAPQVWGAAPSVMASGRNEKRRGNGMRRDNGTFSQDWLLLDHNPTSASSGVGQKVRWPGPAISSDKGFNLHCPVFLHQASVAAKQSP